MSSTTPNAKQASTPPPSKPIDVLNTQPSQFYANLHPILILTLLFIHFKTLVEDPVNTLLALSPTIAALQALYCVLCLPSTGQSSSPSVKPGQKKKAGKPAQDLWARIVPAVLSLLLTLTLSAPVLYIILILFGAPLTTHQPHTLLLALHLALFTTPQLYYAHGLDTGTWLKIASLQLPVDELYGMSLGACVGSWIGAIPIPLDWDREWQKWPVTVLTGMWIGAVVGKVVGGYLVKGLRMKIS